MKKTSIISLIFICVLLALSGCSNKYKEGVDVPKDYPEELVIYDDAIIFEVVEEDDEIVIIYGVEDDIDDVSEFYMDAAAESMNLIFNDWDEGRDDYTAEGIGSCYDFNIEAKEAQGREKRFFDTVVTVIIEYDEDRIELMEDMQGNWMNAGLDGEVSDRLHRSGNYYIIDDNTYELYSGFEPIITDTYVFFLDGKSFRTKSISGLAEPYYITFETIDDIDVLTLDNGIFVPMHYIGTSDDEIDEYRAINEAWNRMKGFWHRLGANGVLSDEYEGFAYNISDYHFDIYVDLESTELGVLYDYIDADTIEHEFGNKTTTADIIFETIDQVEVMTLSYQGETMHFAKTTFEIYMNEITQMNEPQNFDNLQGLWHMVGQSGDISDAHKNLGIAYEFEHNLLHIFDNFELKESNIPFDFVDEDTFEYTTSTGEIASVDIVFEQIDGIDVVTYSYLGVESHFIKLNFAEFENIKESIDTELSYTVKGFWIMIGRDGEMSDEIKAEGNAVDFTDELVTVYLGYVPEYQITEVEYKDDDTIKFDLGAIKISAEIEFKTVNNVDVLCATILGQEYYFIESTYDEFMEYK